MRFSSRSYYIAAERFTAVRSYNSPLPPTHRSVSRIRVKKYYAPT